MSGIILVSDVVLVLIILSMPVLLWVVFSFAEGVVIKMTFSWGGLVGSFLYAAIANFIISTIGILFYFLWWPYWADNSFEFNFLLFGSVEILTTIVFSVINRLLLFSFNLGNGKAAWILSVVKGLLIASFLLFIFFILTEPIWLAPGR